jgi:NADH-quinone oxidoreductase subunit N
MTFTFTVSAADWARIAPELILAGMALVLLLADILLPRPAKSSHTDGSLVVSPKLGLPAKTFGISGNYLVLPALSLLGLAGAFAATVVLFLVGDHQSAFNSMVGSDFGSLYAYIIILSASILGILLSPAYLNRLNLVHQGEYYALMLLATIGMMLMAAAVSFLMVFLGLEMLSLALYILCGFVTRRQSSQESGMKYFLLSSFASAFLLYGIALIYGATGSTAFNAITKFVASHTHSTNLLLIGMGLLTVGFAFKVSGVPFQAWTTDDY